jgi:hypothetical protein
MFVPGEQRIAVEKENNIFPFSEENELRNRQV